MAVPAHGRDSTGTTRRNAVVQAIASMRERLDEPQELGDIARSALMSPFHFHRVFRTMTTATPRRFLTALRMAEAKRLLLDTTLSATDISILVGYSSFGTFTTQFTKLVGLPPGRFRACAAGIGERPVREFLEPLRTDPGTDPAVVMPCARGRLSERPDGSPGIALAGLFESGIPQERPLTCAIAGPDGELTLPATGTSGYFEVLTVSFALDATVRTVLTESPAAGIYIGATRIPVWRRGVTPAPRFWIRLRPRRPTDPPLLIALPLLAAGGPHPTPGV